ncbi:hypothetical protein ABT084_18110 [Streptomyces sp. NPDC002138]|uniref:hypothetical protein n=1 Tax=Streptomyces sp. NPDC002138 TaxID=3154410 RepID=UPI00331E3258
MRDGAVGGGCVRLSSDEVVRQRIGRQDGDLVLEMEMEMEMDDCDRRDRKACREQREELAELMCAGRFAMVDYSFWNRATRPDGVHALDQLPHQGGGRGVAGRGVARAGVPLPARARR